MTMDFDWGQTILRLFLTVVAAAAIGTERETESRPAGLRTTLLVALAACISMIQMYALLSLRGKTPDSYAVMDLMRLPLGILSGMGFIGAGAILRKDNLIEGVTTAATLWFVTVMGLCFGGGQLGLGCMAAVSAFAILRGLRRVEQYLQHEQRAVLRMVAGPGGPQEEQITGILQQRGYAISSWSVAYYKVNDRRELSCQVHWRARLSSPLIPVVLDTLQKLPDVLELEWSPAGSRKNSIQ